MMIDIFNHFMPKAYLDRLGDLPPGDLRLRLPIVYVVGIAAG